MPAKKYNLLTDSSLYTLIVSNLLNVYLALTQSWSLINLVWIYLLQSVLIGVLNYMRMRRVENDQWVPEVIPQFVNQNQEWQKHHNSIFFRLHFGIFHFVYLCFAFTFSFVFPGLNIFSILIGIASLAAHHIYSYWQTTRQESTKDLSAGKLMLLPYVRIIPMHIITLIGLFVVQQSTIGLLIFLSLKIISDIAAHIMNHAWDLRKSDIIFWEQHGEARNGNV